MIRIGIIGCGRIVEVGHVPALVELRRQYRVVALADPAEERRQTIGRMLAAAGLPEPAGVADYRDLFGRANVDAVLMALPHSLHREAVLAAARAGMPVISEKPLATTVRHAKEMARACERRRVPLVVIHNYLHVPAHAKAIELIETGAIGRPFLVRSEGIWGSHWSGTGAFDPDWRTKGKMAGGGCLLDNGYHNLYLCRAFLRGDALSVAATIATFGARKSDVDDTALLLLHHASGGVASVQTAWSVPASGVPVHEIHGTEGSISFTRTNPGTGKPAPIAIFKNATGRWSYPPLNGMPENSFTGFLRAWHDPLADWIKNTGTAVPTNAADAIQNLAVIEAAYKSGRLGRVVAVPR